MCKHCGRFGHDKSNCFEIIGYPSGWGSRGKGSGRVRGSRGSQTTGNRGRGGGREAACSADALGSGQQQVQGTQYEEQSNDVLSGLTSDQVQRLLSLIEPSKPGYENLAGKPLRIIDSGASRYMTGVLQSLC